MRPFGAPPKNTEIHFLRASVESEGIGAPPPKKKNIHNLHFPRASVESGTFRPHPQNLGILRIPRFWDLNQKASLFDFCALAFKVEIFGLCPNIFV